MFFGFPFSRRAAVFGVACVVTALTRVVLAVDPSQIDAAITSGKKFLYSQQKDGVWETEVDKDGVPTIGRTAMVVEALLAAGENPQDERLAPAIDKMLKTPTDDVRALAMRCQVWNRLPRSKEVERALHRDARALINGADEKGKYKGFYASTLDGKDSTLHNTYYAVIGVWAASQAGVEVKTEYWQQVEKTWQEQQDPSGGWVLRGKLDARQVLSLGVTANGIASLFITQDHLHADEALSMRGNVKNPQIDRGMKWLADHLPQLMDGKNTRIASMYSTLYAIERVGAASGLKFIGSTDWYDAGAKRLLEAKRTADGAWPGDGANREVSGTCFALLFLSRGRAPLVMSKLQYDVAPNTPGNWNQRPRDVANITRWISRQTERDLNWQIVNLAAPVAELHDAPILFLAGNQELKFTDADVRKLRDFVEGGGMIVGNVDVPAAGYVASFKQLAKTLFPDYEMRPLPPTHPIFTREQFPADKWKRKPTVLSVSNGARELMMFVPDLDVSRAWQMQQSTGKEELFQLAANLFFYAVDKTEAQSKGQTYQVVVNEKIKPSQTTTVARLKYSGTWDPEPGGWRRIAAIVNNSDGVGLRVLAIDPSKDSFGSSKLAHLTGVGKFKLSDEARAAIKAFVLGGGTLLVDAAGGNADFQQSAQGELAAIFGEPASQQLRNPLPPSHALYSAFPRKLEDVGYRDFARERLGKEFKSARLRGIEIGGRVSVIYSGEDLSVGLVGQAVDGVLGYDPKTATAIVRNLILMNVGKSKPAGSEATTKPISAGKPG